MPGDLSLAVAMFCLLFGALIGVSAAQKRGFSIAGGIIGGLLLGVLSPLLYLVSEGRVKCPFCAEWVKKEAVACPHCQKEIAAVSR